ncbi:response regulator [Halorubrum vacuolatum]|uniref:histidine kinase n=1 Tax=Halorubrum vacuolatum TaxID=63740 RepID=A0A238XYI3_HALVU|nr:PAS domain S-box protein [Halorubrum vacuolatum]SNR63782.1 PAS domain S-box-containing protein [Halorubrum vacuolatum]
MTGGTDTGDDTSDDPSPNADDDTDGSLLEDPAVHPPLDDDIVVLHVDDEPDIVELTGTFLRRSNERIETLAATSVEEGLEVLERESVDCVVTDYDMPGRDGIEFLRLIRERHGDLPVVLFTGRGSEEVASEAISAGVSDYLRKEGGTDQYTILANRIETLVSRSRAEKRLYDHLDRMTDAFFSVDDAWRFTFLNGEAERTLRRDRTELLGRSIWETFPEAVGSELEAAYRETMRTGEPTTLEYYYPPLDTDFEVYAYPSDAGLSVYFRDISERRRREQAVRDLSERLELALEGAEIGVWDWNVETDEVTFDERWAEMLGYELDELDPDLSTWEDRVHPDDADAVWEALEAHFAGETEQYHVDHRMRTKNGTWRWIRDRGRVVERGPDGKPRRAVGIHIDVTEEKARERTLERYKRVVDEMPESAAIYDEDGRFVLVNEHLASVYGESVDALVGEASPFIERLRGCHPDDPFAALVEGERERCSGTTDVELPDGAESIVDYDLVRLVIDGRFDGVLGIYRNITPLKRREERLRETTERLEALFERSPDMINIHDADGRIVDVNRSICTALGYPPEELVGMRVWEVDTELDPESALEMWETTDVDETLRIETTYRRSDGTTFPVEVHVRRIGSRGEDQFLASSRDISTQRAYARRLERENERLEEFTSIVSHDLRNPINVLSGYLELARETGDPAYFDRCERAVSDMTRLIDDLLTLAKQGKRVGEYEPVSLDTLAERFKPDLEQEGMGVEINATGTVSADPGRLTQLLENLLRNAVEHGGSTVTVGDLPDGFYVEDDGPGIPPEERENVFKSGYTSSESGTGFGLSIVKGIADAHGWTVAVTAAESGGARFEITGAKRPETEADPEV